MTPEITCTKCSAKFPLDEALNRQLELNVRSELERQYSDKLAKETARLRGQAEEKAREDARQELVEIKAKLEDKSGQLDKAHENEAKLLKRQADLEEQARLAKLEAQRTLSEE